MAEQVVKDVIETDEESSEKKNAPPPISIDRCLPGYERRLRISIEWYVPDDQTLKLYCSTLARLWCWRETMLVELAFQCGDVELQNVSGFRPRKVIARPTS